MVKVLKFKQGYRLTATLALLVFVVLIAIVVSAFSGDSTDYPGGSPAGYTGSPADMKDCQQCHGGSSAPVTNWITSDIPPEGYTPGSVYTITVAVSGSGRKGFQVSPQNLAGDLLGTLINGTGTEINGSGKYITQSSSTTANPATWSFQWEAPATGTGEVTFYGAFTVSKPVTKTSTLTVNEAVSALSVVATTFHDTLCVGSTTLLNAQVTGATAPVEYLWSSDPPGFSSTLQSPEASPVVTTTYTVVATSAGQSVSSEVQVFVVVCTNTQSDAVPSDAKVFYNPQSRKIVIRFTGEVETGTRVRMMNMAGALKADKAAVASEMAIEAGALSSGLVIIEIASPNHRRVQKLWLR
ncbi:MAG: hypothetical protein PHQ65_03100 [Bacteroidales bacterium]|nr:hypothetical protein [Bacteroidales bacterium]MDD3664227.1 hypothetical protein [Bacteroidales bacterium]